jgi:hypothetical protein
MAFDLVGPDFIDSSENKLKINIFQNKNILTLYYTLGLGVR